MSYSAFVLICLIILSVLVVSVVKIREQESDYDERQVLARGRAYQAGFMTMMMLNFIAFLLMNMNEALIPYGSFFLIGSFFVSITVFSIMTVATDAFQTRSEKAG